MQISASQSTISARPSSGSKPKPLLIALAVLVIALYAAYRHWIGTPQYSLLQARRAAQAHDLNRFEKYVDIESCAAGLIDDVAAESIRQAAKTANIADNPWGKVGEKLGGQMAQAILATIKPTLIVLFRQQVREYIENGAIEPTGDKPFKMGVSVKDIEEKAREQHVKFGGIEYVRKEGGIALVGLAFTTAKGSPQSFTVELKMRRTDNGWQVSRWNNAAQLIQKLVPVPTPPAAGTLPPTTSLPTSPAAEATPGATTPGEPTPTAPMPEGTPLLDPTPTMPAQ